MGNTIFVCTERSVAPTDWITEMTSFRFACNASSAVVVNTKSPGRYSYPSGSGTFDFGSDHTWSIVSKFAPPPDGVVLLTTSSNAFNGCSA